MSQSRQEEEEEESEPEGNHHSEPEAAENEPEGNAEEPGASPSACPLISSTEQAQKQDSWFWGWLPFPLLSGLTWLGERNRPLQEPVCSQLERKRSSGKMCPECEITFCKKCETLHYSRAFIEHGLLGHTTEKLPEILSPTLSAVSIDLPAAPEEAEDEEINRQ